MMLDAKTRSEWFVSLPAGRGRIQRIDLMDEREIVMEVDPGIERTGSVGHTSRGSLGPPGWSARVFANAGGYYRRFGGSGSVRLSRRTSRRRAFVIFAATGMHLGFESTVERMRSDSCRLNFTARRCSA